MSDDDDSPKPINCQWVITHDTAMRHFFLEFHLSTEISASEFLEELESLVEAYKENPNDLFDGSEVVEAQ